MMMEVMQSITKPDTAVFTTCSTGSSIVTTINTVRLFDLDSVH